MMQAQRFAAPRGDSQVPVVEGAALDLLRLLAERLLAERVVEEGAEAQALKAHP